MCRSQGDYKNEANGWLNAFTHPHGNLCGVASNGSTVVVEKQTSILNSAGCLSVSPLAERAFHHIR